MSKKKRNWLHDVVVIAAIIAAAGAIIAALISAWATIKAKEKVIIKEKIIVEKPSIQTNQSQPSNKPEEPVVEKSSTDKTPIEEHLDNSISGIIIFNDGRRINFTDMKANFYQGSWSRDVYYSSSIESKSDSNWIYLNNILKIDFMEITKAEREKDPDYRWLLKAKITFKNNNIVWDSIYLRASGWLYTSDNGNGHLIKFGYMTSEDYKQPNDVKSIIFNK